MFAQLSTFLRFQLDDNIKVILQRLGINKLNKSTGEESDSDDESNGNWFLSRSHDLSCFWWFSYQSTQQNFSNLVKRNHTFLPIIYCCDIHEVFEHFFFIRLLWNESKRIRELLQTRPFFCLSHYWVYFLLAIFQFIGNWAFRMNISSWQYDFAMQFVLVLPLSTKPVDLKSI